MAPNVDAVVAQDAPAGEVDGLRGIKNMANTEGHKSKLIDTLAD